jgi:hypothetical protein
MTEMYARQLHTDRYRARARQKKGEGRGMTDATWVARARHCTYRASRSSIDGVIPNDGSIHGSDKSFQFSQAYFAIGLMKWVPIRILTFFNRVPAYDRTDTAWVINEQPPNQHLTQPPTRVVMSTHGLPRFCALGGVGVLGTPHLVKVHRKSSFRCLVDNLTV